MNRQPSVTVITVCYNAHDMLRKTIDSVLGQDYPLMEYIIVDGASTDGTVRMLEVLDGGNVKVQWISEPDRGIYDAMNKGVALAGGEWVIFMNAGDTFYSPTTISDVFSHQYNPDVEVIYGDVAKSGHDGNIVIKKAGEPYNSHRMFFCHQSAFTRREALTRHPFDISHRFSADFKFYKTLINEGSVMQHIDVPVSVFDTTGVSNSRRSEGLHDNISVIMETDTPVTRLRLLPRLWLPYIMCRLRGK